MQNSPLEFLAQKYGNVVMYDANGNPSVFVKIPKMKSSDLHPSLPNHTHPAFIINGVEQDYILIGKYMASMLDPNSDIYYSLPNMPPEENGADYMLARCRNFGGGASGVTVADRGLILLIAQKMGWAPTGNDCYGHYSGDAPKFDPAQPHLEGEKVGYHGWLYECLSYYSADSSILPDNSPRYWKKLYQIGGTEADPNDREDNQCTKTLTGSGPAEWYLDGTVGSIADLCGNLSEVDYGYRTVNGEIQILENNDAASPDADLSDNSAAWKAILPNENDSGHTLVAPGTPGTLKWNYDNGLVLDTYVTTSVPAQIGSRPFNAIPINPYHVSRYPDILFELGIIGMPGSTDAGIVCEIVYGGTYQPKVIHTRGGNYQNTGTPATLGTMDVIPGDIKHGVRLRLMEL